MAALAHDQLEQEIGSSIEVRALHIGQWRRNDGQG